ncbi:hypothetical protein Lser_V15G37685 [Lactuca serriola]
MISVGSRDGRKGLSLRYGVEGGDMDLETELEEGEACFQNNNDDDSTIDPDVALSYLDEKLQDVLGHFQKDFEGGVSAENLGAKFGGYGSFLPTYQRSPACPHPKTPPKIPTNNQSISPNDLHVEGGRQSSVSTSNASQSTKHGPVLTGGASAPPPRGHLMNGKVKQEGHPLFNKAGDKFTSNGQSVNNFANISDQKSLKVRIKVGSDNLSTQKNAEIYSGLGLDVSPSSSLEASPVDSDDFCHLPNGSPHEESPTSILEMMTSFPVLGGLLLSPLPYELLYLNEKEKREDSSCGSVHKKSQETTLAVNRPDIKVDRNEKKPKTEGNLVPPELKNVNIICDGIGGVTKKEADMDNLSCEEPLSNGMRVDFRKGAAFKGGSSGVTPKEESLYPVLTPNDIRAEKPYKKDSNSDEKYPTFPTKSDSDVSKNGKVQPPKQKAAHKATSREKDSTKLATSSSGGKKKSKGSLENGFESVEVLKVKNDPSKSKNNAHGLKTDDPRGNNVKVRDTYKDFFGEPDPELEEGDDMALEEKPFGDRQKDNRVTEKGTLETNILSKDRLNGKKDQKPSSVVYPGMAPLIAPITGPTPVSDAASGTVAAVVNEDWVCCDKCEKWRLLPPGVNPSSLPEKWLCSMLEWLPGMNRCSISQEETTKAIMAHFPGPAPTAQGLQPVHPGGPMSLDPPPHPDQRHHLFGPQAAVKKKHGTKDVPNEPKQERPSLSSNSAKKNLQTSNKTRSLNGAHHSPSHLEFQDSGQSSSMIAEKHRLKHKEKKKLRENFVDEGNNNNNHNHNHNNNPLQLKIKNKRETGQDCSRDSKKVKTDDNHGTDKDWASDHKKYDDRLKDSKSASKVLGMHPKNPNGTPHVVHKRKSNEFEEETSENGHRKGKRVKVPEPREEEMFTSKGEGRIRVIDSSKRDHVPMPLHASLAATSSSSKVSGSHKTKTNTQEAKGSPVESVSSSPLRILNPDKLIISSRRNIEGVDNCQDAVSPKKDWEEDRGSFRSNTTFKKDLDVTESLDKGLGKVEIAPSLEFETFRVGTSGAKPSAQGHNDDRSHSNGSRSRKNGKGSSSRSKDKNRSSKSDIDKINLKISDVPIYEEKSKAGRHKSQEKPSVYPDKFEKGSASKKDSSKPLSENTSKRDPQPKHGHNDDSAPVPVHDVKQNNMSMERDVERISKKDVSGRGKSHSLPPTGKGQNDASRPPQPCVVSQKENGLLVDAAEGSDVLKGAKQKKKVENQSTSVRHPTPPNRHNKGRGDHDAPSPLRRESSSQAASAVKEAKALKHMADRLKNSGSNHESNSLYFQAALKFLYGSSLLESSHSETGKHGDMIQSMVMYGSTAKLCEYVAHEYEKSKEMAAAALAYKLAEVAYLKVVYSSHTNACKDRQELQSSLQIGPTGESPSSSASDIDNLNNNNPAAVDKAAIAKGVSDPQIAGNHVIAARNKPNFLRILNFAQDVNFAMEASRRSQIAYAACGSQPEHAHHKEIIKPALDFNFQDVEGLLQLVRVAMEVISR